MGQERRLVVIDDALFRIVKGCLGEKSAGKPFLIEKAGLPRILNEGFKNEKADSVPLKYLLQHAANGNFFGLTELIVYDLDEKICEDDFFSKAESVQNSVILLDIYNEKDKFPTGLDIAEILDQSIFTDKIAWFSVTGTLSAEYKPYPLIRKREIPPLEYGERDDNHRDTIFVWWGLLFRDFDLEDQAVAKGIPRKIAHRMREIPIVSSENIVEEKNDLLVKSGKSARKGGLAGNIIKPVLWKKGKEADNGKIVNAFLKVSGKGADLKDEIHFLQENKEDMDFPEVYYPGSSDPTESFYCMEKIKGTSLSDLVFEKIGFQDATERLNQLLEQIYMWHAGAHKEKMLPGINELDKPDSDESVIIGYVTSIKNRISTWVKHNKFFEPLIYPKTLIINNLQYFNALYLCNRIEETYNSLRSLELEPLYRLRVHGDIVAQNVFVKNRELRLIDPRGKIVDYLADYYKLFSSFSGQGHLEYLSNKKDSKSAHFYVNEGIDPNGCHYVCSPSLDDSKGIKECQNTIINHLWEKNKPGEVYALFERNNKSWENRFLLGLAKQYLGAPPLRDKERFHDEMKFLYYRGVEILNEFCERMGILEPRQRIFPQDCDQEEVG